MTLSEVVQQILNECPVCGFHSASFAEFHCTNPNHNRLRKAIINDPAYHENQQLRDHIEALEHEISNLKERLERVAGCAQNISGEMAHIDDAVSLNG